MDNDKRKTASEIIAEMREFGKQAAIVDHERVSPECLLLFADRLDAALARYIGDAQEKAASRAVLDRTLRDAAEYYAKAVLSRDGAPTSPAPNETFGDILRDMDFGRIPPHVCDVEITKHYAERIKAAINRAREDGLSGDDQFAPHYCGAPGSAFAHGELAHARQELAQCAAVCIRGMEYIEDEIAGQHTTKENDTNG